ncbi:MAG TPA: sensor histidine kinase [Bryobacterales bacterium]|nr:sensor histidine kinase [Bryobacterales bacterium]
MTRLFAQSRASFAKTLEALAPHAQAILSEWLRRLRVLGFREEDISVLATVELPFRIASLRRMKFDSLRHKLELLGKKLAAHCVPLDHAIAALSLLFEVCLSHLVREPAADMPVILALTRFQHVVGAIFISGYLERRDANEHTLETRLTEAEHRLHGASAYVTDIYERERRRLSQDLHDDIGHDLMLLKLQLELMAADLDTDDLRQFRPRLEEALSLSGHAINSVRRVVLDLGPALLEDLGLVPAIRLYARQFAAGTGIQAAVHVGCVRATLPSSHQIALYRIIQGAFANVLKHSKAQHVKVSLGSVKNSRFVMIIEDDGLGFDPAGIPPRQAFGLTAMRERVEVLGGSIDVQSSPAGAPAGRVGTRIEVDLPLPTVGRKRRTHSGVRSHWGSSRAAHRKT